MNKEVMAMLGMKPVKKLSGGAHARNNPDVTVTLPKSGGLYISFRKDLMKNSAF